MCVSQWAKKAINWQKKGAQQEMEMKEISSLGFGAFICFVFCFGRDGQPSIVYVLTFICFK